MSKAQRFALFSSVMILVFAIAAWYLQAQIWVNWDVIWDVLGSQRLLAHQSLLKDFFDINPPPVIYLYAPAVWLSGLMQGNLVLGLDLYLILLSFLSLGLCAYLCYQIFFPKHPEFALVFLASIAGILLIAPFYQWGEREHLACMLSFPYLLLMVCRIENRALSKLLCLCVGVLAGIGFMAKPYFLIPLVLIELYYLWYRKNILASLRIETLVILAYGFIFVGLICFYFPGYLSTIVPDTQAFYYLSMRDAWTLVVLQPFASMAYLAILFYGVFYQKHHYRAMTTVFCLACLGFLCAYFLQHTHWIYHLYPAFALAVLLFVLYSGSAYFISHRVVLALFLMCLVEYLGIYLVYAAEASLNYKKLHLSLQRQFESDLGKQSFMMLSANGTAVFPASYYAGAPDLSRFMHLYWLPAIAKLQADHLALSAEQALSEKRFKQRMVEDIALKKPKYILVDSNRLKSFFQCLPFDYLSYFFQDPAFQGAFKPYRYVETIRSSYDLNHAGKTDWDLLVYHEEQALDAKDFSHPTVLMKKKGAQFEVSLVQAKKFFASEGRLCHFAYAPSDQESVLLSREEGVVKKTPENQAIVDQIIQKARSIPLYEFQVYRREEGGLS